MPWRPADLILRLISDSARAGVCPRGQETGERREYQPS